MSTINIKSSFFPFRFVMKDKKPVELTVEVTNTSPEKKLLSFEMTLPAVVGLGASGMQANYAKKIGDVKSGETKTFVFPLNLSVNAEPGNFYGKATVIEHMDSFDYILKTHSKEIEVKVIK